MLYSISPKMTFKSSREPATKRARLTTSFDDSLQKYDKVIIIILRNPDGETEEDNEALTSNANRLKSKLIRNNQDVEIIEYDSSKSISLKHKSTDKTKIIISGHGCIETNELAGRTPDWVAEIIYNDLEIERAKTITLFSCNLGSSLFATEFKNQLHIESDGAFMPSIRAYTLPVMVFEDGEIMADKGEDDETGELEFVPAKNYKIRI